MHLSVRLEDGILFWQLQRPERLNALGPTLGQALLDALQKLQEQLAGWPRSDGTNSPPVRALVLSAAPIAREDGPPIWIAGGDLKELASLATPGEGRSYAWLFAELCLGLQDLPIPVLTLIDGLAIGGGVELALAADLRLATRRSSFHFKQLEVGLATGYGSCQRLVALVGQARATDLLFRCRRLSAEEALHCGLINELASDEQDLQNLSNSVLSQLARLSPQSLRVQKFMLQQGASTHRSTLIQGELDAFSELWMQPAHSRFLAPYTQGAKDEN